MLCVVGVVSAALLTGCSAVEDAAQEQVDSATAQAGQAVKDEVKQQASSALDEALAEVDSTCSQFLAATDSERTAISTGALQVFWLAELSTEQAGQDAVTSWTGALITACEASGEARVADVARTTYDAGGFGPPLTVSD